MRSDDDAGKGFQPMQLETATTSDDDDVQATSMLWSQGRRLFFWLRKKRMVGLVLLVIFLIPFSYRSDHPSSPPIARREENRVVQVGVAPSGWDLPRQSQESTVPLLDPPVLVPDPYGWMRDDERTNRQVLQHLQAENAYSEHVATRFQSLQHDLHRELLGYMQVGKRETPRTTSTEVLHKVTVLNQITSKNNSHENLIATS